MNMWIGYQKRRFQRIRTKFRVFGSGSNERRWEEDELLPAGEGSSETGASIAIKGPNVFERKKPYGRLLSSRATDDSAVMGFFWKIFEIILMFSQIYKKGIAY